MALGILVASCGNLPGPKPSQINFPINVKAFEIQEFLEIHSLNIDEDFKVEQLRKTISLELTHAEFDQAPSDSQLGLVTDLVVDVAKAARGQDASTLSQAINKLMTGSIALRDHPASREDKRQLLEAILEFAHRSRSGPLRSLKLSLIDLVSKIAV